MKLGLVFSSVVMVIVGLAGFAIALISNAIPKDFLDSMNLPFPPESRVVLFSISAALGGIFGILSTSFENAFLGMISLTSSVVSLSSLIWMVISMDTGRSIITYGVTILLGLFAIEIFLSSYRTLELLVIKSRWRG